MYKINIQSDTPAGTQVGNVIDCIKTRRAAFHIKTNTGGSAVINVQGSIDQETWLTFGTMTTDADNLEDGGNAEFIWPYIRLVVESISTANSIVTITTRV